MAWKHSFRCLKCGKHLTFLTEYEMPVQPGRTHGEALDNGAVHTVGNNTIPDNCSGFGLIVYCSGYDIQNNRDCVPGHKGSYEVVVSAPSAAPPEWGDFCTRVQNGWQNFVNSNYSPALRGVNNFREYHVPPSVSNILRSSGGMVRIGEAVYTVSDSRIAGVSLHRTIPAVHQVGNMKSYIFHL
jgi:hypothetical protein